MLIPEFWLRPELKRFKTKPDAWRAYKTCCRGLGWHLIPIGLSTLVLSIGPLLFLLEATPAGQWVRSLGSPWLAIPLLVVPTVVVGGGVHLIGLWCFRSRMRTRLRHELNNQGVPTCVGCGHDMKTFGKSMCPACGCQHEYSPPQRAALPPSRDGWRPKPTFVLVFGVACVASGLVGACLETLNAGRLLCVVLLIVMGVMNIRESRRMARAKEAA